MSFRMNKKWQIYQVNDEKVKDEMIRKMTEKVGYGPTECYQIGAEVASNAGPKVIGLLSFVFQRQEGDGIRGGLTPITEGQT